MSANHALITALCVTVFLVFSVMAGALSAIPVLFMPTAHLVEPRTRRNIIVLMTLIAFFVSYLVFTRILAEMVWFGGNSNAPPDLINEAWLRYIIPDALRPPCLVGTVRHCQSLDSSGVRFPHGQQAFYALLFSLVGAYSGFRATIYLIRRNPFLRRTIQKQKFGLAEPYQHASQ